MKATEFAVDINIIKGAVDFEVFPSNAQEKTGLGSQTMTITL
jgi:hypothetical protein